MHRHAARRPLLLEPLEDRALPTTATFAAGVLTVTGTPASEMIVVRRVNNVLKVDGTSLAVPAAQVAKVIVNAGAGNDTILLNSQDTPGQQPLGVPIGVNAGDGDDRVVGTPGPDAVYGQNGADALTGGAGSDMLSGGNGADRLDGGDGNDYLLGDYGNDIIYGGAGNDTFYAGMGDDFVDGGAGDDFLAAGWGRDVVSGGDGVDRFQDDYALPNPAAGAAGVLQSIASRRAGDATWASANDVRQQLANTCSLLSALAAFARTSPVDLATRISYNSTTGNYLVPLFLNNAWQQVSVSFNGTWTDNEPSPGPAAADGSRDYWVLLYQRAYLQALNVNTSNPDANQWAVRGTRPDDLMKQSWRYPDVALRTVTGLPATAQPVAGDASVEAIAAAIRDGQDVVANTQTRPDQMGLVCGTGLIFAHAYTVVDADPMTRTVTLRNPWGSDGQATVLTALASGARSIFTLGSDSDGMVSVSWDVFEQAFATYAVA